MPDFIGEKSDLGNPIGKKQIHEAAEILQQYKQGKANLDNRVVEEEEWWELRYWRYIRGKQRGKQEDDVTRIGPEPTSGWLFNAIVNKHADAMDNYPQPTVLPRERSDEETAKTLSAVLPVILQQNEFDQTYSDNWWEKLKHGTAVYGVFWDPRKENGLGDISVRSIDLLKIFWEPGVTDIQKSRNLFVVELVDHDLLNKQYPQFMGKISGSPVDITQYVYNDTVDTSDKEVVVDWYYKVSDGTRTLLHYAKFCGDTLLYASENDPQYAGRGFYDHGMYPVVFDSLFPEKGTPTGFGYVSICRDPQMYIDKLSANILEASMMGTKKRYFVSESTNINLDEFMDWNNPIVHVQGELSDARLQEINVSPVSGVYLDVINQKIEEMKDTASNRDVNSGGATGSVTAASAIAALQEAGNKSSRDMIAASYRAQTKIATLCVELIRQFYDEARHFRITAPNGMGGYDYATLSNQGMRNQTTVDILGQVKMRRPVFDLKISAQRNNPFSVLEQNERAKELYGLGFFNPERAQETLPALEMMDFEGIEKVREYVMQGQTLLNICQQQQQQIMQLTAMLQGQPMPAPGQPPQQSAPSPAPQQKPAGGKTVAAGIMDSQVPRTSYSDRLAKRSRPSMEAPSDAARPV